MKQVYLIDIGYGFKTSFYGRTHAYASPTSLIQSERLVVRADLSSRGKG